MTETLVKKGARYSIVVFGHVVNVTKLNTMSKSEKNDRDFS